MRFKKENSLTTNSTNYSFRPLKNYDRNAATLLSVRHQGAWSIWKIIWNPEVNPELFSALPFQYRKALSPPVARADSLDSMLATKVTQQTGWSAFLWHLTLPSGPSRAGWVGWVRGEEQGSGIDALSGATATRQTCPPTSQLSDSSPDARSSPRTAHGGASGACGKETRPPEVSVSKAARRSCSLPKPGARSSGMRGSQASLTLRTHALDPALGVGCNGHFPHV